MKIAVAMSGGVDSSTAAILLKEEGHDIVGITACLYDGGRSDDEASMIAARFGFPLKVIDLRDEFEKLVMSPFCVEYLAGRTPNPCVGCDAKIKFGRLLEYAIESGCDTLATGHYARIGRDGSGRRYIRAAADMSRDQSYFLYATEQEALARLLFPLGELAKEEVRRLARSFGLTNADRPDSQEICFIPDNDYASFVESRSAAVPAEGDIINTEGRVLGRHRGLHRYTIGQRRGLGIAAERPLYVLALDPASNRVIAGYKEELESGSLVAGDIVRMKAEKLDGLRCLVKNRSTQKPVEARLEECAGGVRVLFDEPQTGISPGQSSVFYDNELCILGGGVIVSSEKSYGKA